MTRSNRTIFHVRFATVLSFLVLAAVQNPVLAEESHRGVFLAHNGAAPRAIAIVQTRSVYRVYNEGEGTLTLHYTYLGAAKQAKLPKGNSIDLELDPHSRLTVESTEAEAKGWYEILKGTIR